MKTPYWIAGILILLPVFGLRADEPTVWKDTVRNLDKALNLEEEKAGLPRSKWFGRDQVDADRDLEEVLNEVLEVLEVSGLTERRDAYRDLGRRIEDRKREIRERREQTFSAPEDVSPLKFFQKSKQDLLDQIEALEEDILALDDRRREVRIELVGEFKGIGLEMEEGDVALYLGTVSGQDLITLGAIFRNIRQLNEQLESLMKDSPGDTEAARRYYGMHMVLLRALLQAHEMTLDRLDNRYLARLEELEKENRKLEKETRDLLKYAGEEEKPMLSGNLRTQQATAEAISLYRDHLRVVRDNVYEAKKKLDRQYEIALNTFRTIRISSQLVREMESALRDLGALRSMQLPALVPIQDEAIREKFLDLGTRLQSE